RLAQRRAQRSAEQATGRLSRRAPDAEPDHRARSAPQAFDRLEQQRRRYVRTGAERHGRAAYRDPSASARSLDHAQGQRRLEHASRHPGRPRQRQGAGAILGWLGPPAAGIRPPAAGLNGRRTRNKVPTNRSLAMQIHAVSAQEWEAARQKLLVKEKELTHARDAMAAERRRMPWMAVEKEYKFEGPKGKASLLDLFDGRRQLIVYRAFFEPGVVGWPEHACVGCSLMADQVTHPAHLNARNTTLVFTSRAPQKDIERLKARM